MVSAYILVQTEVGKASQVTDKIKALGGVVNADGVTGPYDVIARVEAEISTGWRRRSSCPCRRSRASRGRSPAPSCRSSRTTPSGAMTIKIRRDDEISDVDGEWFRARWHFSFDSYQDPEYTSFGTLRVFNDDRLIPGAIWPMHPHRDIEGLTYVVEGSFRHQDDVGGAPGPLPGGLRPADDARVGRLALRAERERDRGHAVHPDLDHARGAGSRRRVSSRRSSPGEDRTDRLLRAISGDGRRRRARASGRARVRLAPQPRRRGRAPARGRARRLPLRDRGRRDRQRRTDDHGRCGRDPGRAADRDRSGRRRPRPRSSWSTCSSERRRELPLHPVCVLRRTAGLPAD